MRPYSKAVGAALYKIKMVSSPCQGNNQEALQLGSPYVQGMHLFAMAQSEFSKRSEGTARQQPRCWPATAPFPARPTTLGFRFCPPAWSPVNERVQSCK
jgi:hypothetical protein